MRNNLRVISILILIVWLGSIFCLSFIVAPTIFDFFTRPEAYDSFMKESHIKFQTPRTLAGSLVGAMLRDVNMIGLIAAPLLIVFEYVICRQNKIAAKMPLVALGVLMVICYANALGLTPLIESVRSQISGPVEALDVADPLRREFGRLHALSIFLFLFQLFFGFAIVWLWSREEARREEITK